jgi:hypothetical protein
VALKWAVLKKSDPCDQATSEQCDQMRRSEPQSVKVTERERVKISAGKQTRSRPNDDDQLGV